ncbi:MAG TPA: hypothetical protein VJ810_15370 [Blastocatellia bacterium]|nr:hypothetical protein [Blastocatellia bacterium]
MRKLSKISRVAPAISAIFLTGGAVSLARAATITVNTVKFLTAKLQILPFSYRIAGSAFLLAVLLLNSLLIAGCAPNATITGTINNFAHIQIEMENVRFETHGLPGNIPTIQPARAYWLKRGEKIAPKWDTLEWHWENQGAMMTCDFRSNVSSGNCQVCDYCNPPSSTNGPPCMGISSPNVVGDLRIVADPGYIQTGNPGTIINYADSSTYLRTCNNTQNPLIFEPQMSGLYRFLALDFKFNFVGGTDGEVKIHLVEPSGESSVQTTAYQLTPQVVDGVNYWTWTIEGDPYWLENFSPNLRVTDILIFRGKCADGSAQGKRCAVPTESVAVRPSRLFFLPGFQNTVSGYIGEAAHRCYSDLNAAGPNFINLESCRDTFNANQTTQRFATPTYESLPVRPTEKITWLVEFNTSEGADADLTTPANDPMPMDAELIIQFVIKSFN